MRKLYEVRFRIKVGPNRWQKKSRFYWAQSPDEAARCYKGDGYIMSVEKTSKDKLLGVGSFFTLGGDLLKDLQAASTEQTLEKQLEDKKREKEKHRERRFYAKQRKEATN